MSSRGILTEWIRQQYDGKRIKKTSQPYFDHLLFVAEKSDTFLKYGYEIGLCHDLLEDTTVTANELQNHLQSFGYPKEDAAEIVGAVVELTDVFTKTTYPDLSKKKRKKQEARRLISTNAAAQTVKYADLINNGRWMQAHEPQKAWLYFIKKRKLVAAMSKGDHKLRQEALAYFDGVSYFGLIKSKKMAGAWLICLLMIIWGGIHFLDAVAAHNTAKMWISGTGVLIFLGFLIAMLVISIKKRPNDVR